MALKHSPEFCLKPIYRYLLKAAHFSGDTCGGYFWPQGQNFSKLGRSAVDDATYQIPMPLQFQTRRFFMFSLYKPLLNM